MKYKTGGVRDTKNKLEWSLVDFKALESMVHVLEFGATKYEPYNWKKGLPYTGTINSMLRHIYAFLHGEDIDQESGIPHTGHILCNAMFLSHYFEQMKSMDDRFIDNEKKENKKIDK